MYFVFLFTITKLQDSLFFTKYNGTFFLFSANSMPKPQKDRLLSFVVFEHCHSSETLLLPLLITVYLPCRYSSNPIST